MEFNAVHAIIAYPAGKFADRKGRKTSLILSYILFGLTYLTTFYTPPFVTFFVYGTAVAFFEVSSRTLAAELAGSGLRGSGFGLFYLATASGMFAGNIIAGYLWDHVGRPAAFMFGTVTCAIAVVLSLIFIVEPGPERNSDE